MKRFGDDGIRTTLAPLCAAVAAILVVMPHTAHAADMKAAPSNMILKAAPSGDDKSAYTLFNPTPDRLLRDFSTDRPDTTESPFTVDAGRFQFETNLFGYTRSRPDIDGTVSDTYEIGTTNARIGLTSNTELSLIFQPYGTVRTRAIDPFGIPSVTHQSGVGNLDIRTKINLWGNDTFEKAGATAFGLLPFLTLPVDRGNGISSDGVEGGLILPFAIKLSDPLSLGLNTGVNVVRNDDGLNYHSEYLASASFAYDWSDNLSTYYEVAARFNTRNPLGDVAMLGTGFSYKLSKNVQVDAGVNIGVTRAADRYNPFVGISRRF
jgi:hypothetical protein